VRRAAVAIVFVLAGCGGEERLTKPEFVRQANAICAKYERRLDAIPQPRELRDVQSYIDRGVPLAKGELAELEELRPPERDEPAVERLLAQVEATISELERLGEAAAARDREAAQAAAARVEEAGARAAKLARDYGLDECGD
jgi:hypothetical protein